MKLEIKKNILLAFSITIVICLFPSLWNFTAVAQNQKNKLPKRVKQSKSVDNQSITQSSKGVLRVSVDDMKAKVVDLTELAVKQSNLEIKDRESAEAETYLGDSLGNQREVPLDAISPIPDKNFSPMFNTQNFEPSVASPTTNINFQALPDNLTSIPPDTHGAVGLNHIMTVLNTQIRIQNKVGSVILTISLNSFWSQITSNGVFDPKILYDPYANRWLFTACDGQQSTGSGVLIAVSQTSDPTGSWQLYRVVADNTGQTWADYPSFGFNKDWAAVSLNMFTVGNNNPTGTKTFVFRKNAIFNGTLGFKAFPLPDTDGFTITPAITYSATEPTLYMLSAYNGNSNGNGYLRLYTITGAVGSETLTPTGIYPQSGGNPWYYTLPNNFAPQFGVGVGIMAGDNRMQNVIYRNGFLWATHSIYVPANNPSRSAIQWWQINPSTGGVLQIGRVEDISNTNFYAFPSIAVNQTNDVLIGYAAFSAFNYATGSYSFRAASDTANTLRDSAILKSGLGCYYRFTPVNQNRWGDYSNTVVDPSDDTNFWTIQEYADTPNGQCLNGSGRWGTWWGKVSPSGGGTCTYSLNPTSQSFSSAGGSGFTNVTTQSGCSWTATVNAPSSPETVSLSRTDDKSSFSDNSASAAESSNTLAAPEALYLNSTPITINDRSSSSNPPGTASLYPSSITVSGMSGTITQVTAALNNVSHTYPDDIDVLLVGPSGQRAILMSDAGGGADLSGVNLTFDQSAAALPDDTQIVSGNYRPTNFSGNATLEPSGVDNFPSPAPGQTNYAADLGVFNGSSANGTWQLYVVDDENQDAGSIMTGWALGITTSSGGTTWINITSGASGTGNGTVNYSVSANPNTTTRTGTISVNGQVHTVTQAGVGCSYSITSSGQSIGSGNGSASFGVNTSAGCAWSAISSNSTWLTTSSSGSGNGTVQYNYTANTGSAQRNATITVQGQVHTVTQAGTAPPLTRKAFDFDGDGKSDISIFRPSNGIWYLLNSTSGFGGLQFGASGDKIVPADYDGDGKTDVAVYRTGNWYVQRSSLGFVNVQFGQNGDIPVPADFDGDGKTDFAVYRPSIGTWFLQRTRDGFAGVQFGLNGDVPIGADFDGDGKADLAVWRPSNGIWYIQQTTLGFGGVQFGAVGDKLVPADYDGDGKTDVAVFRPSNGFWYLNRSSAGFIGMQFGTSADIPVAADYDGDGKTDIGVYRNDTWLLQRTTAGFMGIQFGGIGDKPAPNAFVP